MDLWLVRHGTTKANLQGRLQGRLDFPLGDEGKKEVLLLARRLKEQRFSFFFSSTLQRARETHYYRAGVLQPILLPCLRNMTGELFRDDKGKSGYPKF